MSVVAVATFSFTERVTRLLERVDYRLAATAEDREAVFRLRYDAYVREGALKPDLARRLSDPYDELPNAPAFAVYIDGVLASSVRLHVALDGVANFPAAQVFPEILLPELEQGKRIIDPTRFVADATCARLYPELPYVTLRIAYMAAEYFDADLVLAAVRPEHQAFYRRVFGHKPISPTRPYLTLTKPLSLMMLHYPPAREQIVARYPFFRSTLFERRMLFENAVALAQRSAA